MQQQWTQHCKSTIFSKIKKYELNGSENIAVAKMLSIPGRGPPPSVDAGMDGNRCEHLWLFPPVRCEAGRTRGLLPRTSPPAMWHEGHLQATFHHVSNLHYQVATEAVIHLFCALGEAPHSVFFDSNEYFCEGKNAKTFVWGDKPACDLQMFFLHPLK